MSVIEIAERDFTPAELESMRAGFAEHDFEHGNPSDPADRFSFIACKDEAFIGCSSGLAYRKDVGYCDWLYLTDLYVAKSHRHGGLGSRLLMSMEHKAISVGIPHIWTWTAGYQAPEFYIKHGYVVFVEMPNLYPSGDARIGLSKKLIPEAQQVDPRDAASRRP